MCAFSIGDTNRITLQPQVVQLRHRQGAIGRAGIARGKNHLAVFHAVLGQLQKMARLDRLAVFIGAQKRRIQRKTRKHKIVGIPAKRPQPRLRHPHQPHLLPHLVAIQPILPAAIQRHHLAAQLGLVRAFFFNRGNHRLPLARVRLGIGKLRRHLVKTHQHGHFRAGAHPLLSRTARQKSIADQIVGGARQTLHTRHRHMVIGQNQTIRRHKRRGRTKPRR